MDQPAGGGGRAEWVRAGSVGPGAACNQRGPGGAPSHCGGGGHRGPRCDPHQLQGGEAENAPARLLPGGPTGPHLRGLQHVNTFQKLMRKAEPSSENRRGERHGGLKSHTADVTPPTHGETTPRWNVRTFTTCFPLKNCSFFASTHSIAALQAL